MIIVAVFRHVRHYDNNNNNNNPENRKNQQDRRRPPHLEERPRRPSAVNGDWRGARAVYRRRHLARTNTTNCGLKGVHHRHNHRRRPYYNNNK